jgi:hypothetical protein
VTRENRILVEVPGRGRFRYWRALQIIDFVPAGKQKAKDEWPLHGNTSPLQRVGRILAEGYLK